jgi:hypothetical protein
MATAYVEVPVGHGFVALVDAADAGAVSPFRWHSQLAATGRVRYARRTLRAPDGRWLKRYMHTYLTGWGYVDHINGDGLDNRRANLREVTNAQNHFNRAKSRIGSSQYKGVCWHRARRRWRADIMRDGRSRTLGYFDDEEAAARAYDAAARELFGEYARPNFPE